MVGVLLVSVVLAGVGFRLGAFALGWTGGRSTAPGAVVAAATYSALGPHAVGLQTLTIGRSEPMDALLWYPAEAVGSGSVRYTYGLKAFGDGPFALATYRGIGIRGAEAGIAGGPYPLVILSPGFAFGAATYAWLAEHLASHGFAVLAMEHVEELDPSALWQATIDRPRDTVAALDYVDADLRSGAWSGLVDSSRVAVVGHSYGGYTALAAAGAGLDSTRLREICEAAPSGDPIAFQCEALAPRIGDMAAAAGLDEAPGGLWPSWGDVRVDAAVALAGDAVMFGEAGMAAVEVPVMAIGGTADVDSPYAWGTRLAYEAASSQRKVEIGLEGAEHMIFTGPCEASRRVLTILREPFCADPAWERAEAHDLVRHYTTAFLLAELKDDADAASVLAPEAIAFPSVRYAATGY
jgi:predicted dienelactone hydrolase